MCSVQNVGQNNYFPANIYLFKVSNRNTRKGSKICSKLAIKTSERRHSRHSDVFIVNFEHVSNLFPSVSIVDFEQVNVSWVATIAPMMEKWLIIHRDWTELHKPIPNIIQSGYYIPSIITCTNHSIKQIISRSQL